MGNIWLLIKTNLSVQFVISCHLFILQQKYKIKDLENLIKIRLFLYFYLFFLYKTEASDWTRKREGVGTGDGGRGKYKKVSGQ